MPSPTPAEHATRSDGEAVRGVATQLLTWYARHRRDLPWRRTGDPYAVWVSEAMLQQTQVATVRSYFERWMQRFPSVAALARAEEDDVLHAWEGLGYYSRARNLLRGARVVMTEHGGVVPRSAQVLRTLPGVGPYSAGAIASIAYGEQAPIVDGNVVRVLCRRFGLRGDPARAPLKAELWRLAERLVPARKPGDFNQALMELGATVCRPREADCDDCPLRRGCVAHAKGLVATLPESTKPPAPTRVASAAALVFRDDRVLCVQVADGAPRWAGMWQFPNADVRRGETPAVAARRAVMEAAGIDVVVGEREQRVRHSVTRYRITMDVFRCGGGKGAARAVGCRSVAWVEPGQLGGLAMPAAHRRIAGGLERR